MMQYRNTEESGIYESDAGYHFYNPQIPGGYSKAYATIDEAGYAEAQLMRQRSAKIDISAYVKAMADEATVDQSGRH